MKKIIKIFMLFVVLFLSIQVPANAETDEDDKGKPSLQDNLVPQDTNAKKIGDVDLKYNDYPMHHYELDTYIDTEGNFWPWNWGEAAGEGIFAAMMEMINAVWQLNILLANLTMLMVSEAFELDFVKNVTKQLGEAIQALAGFGPNGFSENGLFPILITFVITITGAWAVYVGIIKRETSTAWSGLLSSLIVFVCALGFFSNASTFLGGLNSWSSDIQGDVLGVSASIVDPKNSYDADEGIASIRNQMYDLMIYKPYLLMQYGTTTANEGDVEELLKVDPILKKKDRQKLVEEQVTEEKNTMMSADGVSQRAAFVPLLFIANSIMGICLLMLSASIILYQILFLVLALFAPIALLIGLVPKWQQTAVNWISKLLHALLMKIGIALFLTIMFAVSAILYRATDNSNLGYLTIMLIQIIAFVGIWMKRKDLFNMVTSTATNVTAQMSSRGEAAKRFNQAKNLAMRGRDMLRKDTTSRENLADRKDGEAGMAQKQRKQQKNVGLATPDQLAKRDFKQMQKQVNKEKKAEELAERQKENEEVPMMPVAPGTKTKQDDGVERVQGELVDRVSPTDTNEENLNPKVASIEEARRKRQGRLSAPVERKMPTSSAASDSTEKAERDIPATRENIDIQERQTIERNIATQTQQDVKDNVSERSSINQQENVTQERQVTQERNVTRATTEEQVTRTNEMHTENQRNEHTATINRNVENVSNVVENNREKGGHLTQWEIQQKINARKNKEK